MYGVVRTRQFERSFRRLKRSGVLKQNLRDEIDELILLIAERKMPPASYQDHQLTGDMSDYRECHIRGDLLLVYQLQHEKFMLVLIDVGSHSQLFG